MNSILTSVKKMVGIIEEYTHYDVDLINHINATFFTLNQIGVGPAEPFRIEDSEPTWSDFIGLDLSLEVVKTYIYLKVKLLFDPPSNSFVLDSIDRQITQLEWRLNIQAEGGTNVQ